ncbi:MAG: YfcE family phosphodiesterase, partial [Chloroflexi bacterium]|nr:YfcE family phosphodiesterase [Chloroflexota bacterium]
VNGGSVGLPLDGDPRAGYAILDFSGPECTVTLRRVAYDVERVIAELERVEHPARLWVASMLRGAST